MKKIKTIIQILCVAQFMETNLLAQTQIDPGSVGLTGMLGGNSNACVPGATNWYLGGNSIVPPPILGNNTPTNGLSPMPYFDIGTCNDFPFILKANNKKSVWITQGGKIGINNSIPYASLDIMEPNQNSSSNSYFRIYGDAAGNLESSTEINMTFATGKKINFNEGSSQTNTNWFTINTGGNVGIGSQNPGSKLEVSDIGNCDIISYATNNAGTAGLWALNGTTNFGLRIDNNGIGHLSQNMSSPLEIPRKVYR